MYKGYGIWFDSHPHRGVADEVDHDTQIVSAGGFLFLNCDTCHVVQSIDEIDALMRHQEPPNERTKLFVAPSDGHVHEAEAVVKVPGSAPGVAA